MKREEAAIEVYQDKRGKWRWRFLLRTMTEHEEVWDIKAVSSDSHYTPGDAEYEARMIICTAWHTSDISYQIRLPWYESLINYIKGVFT